MAPKQKRPSHLIEQDQDPSHEQQQDHDDNQEGAAPTNSSSSGSDSDSDSDSATESDPDSDSEPENPNPAPNSKVKPLPSKPIEQAPKLKQPQSSSSAAKQAKSLSKRPAENNVGSPDPKHAKKKKKVEAEDDLASDDNDEEKISSRDDSKKMFRRIFSEEDEAALLEGMIEFRSATGGNDPYKCPDAFHDFMMKRSKRISFDASSVQLKEKIRRTKRKFINNARRGKDGNAPKFSNPHELRSFVLAQKIWGEGAEGEGGVNNGTVEKARPNDGKAGKKTTDLKKKNTSENAEKLKTKPELAKAKLDSELQLPPAESEELGKVDEMTEKGVALDSMIAYDKVLGEYGLGEYFLRKGNGLIEASKMAEFDGKWAKLEAAELELRVKRAELYANHAKSMLQAIKSSRN